MGKNFDVRTVQDAANATRTDMRGTCYKHYKGGVYIVLDVLVDTNTSELRVSYLSDEHNYRWSRPLSEWMDMVDPATGKVVEQPTMGMEGSPRYVRLP